MGGAPMPVHPRPQRAATAITLLFASSYWLLRLESSSLPILRCISTKIIPSSSRMWCCRFSWITFSFATQTSSSDVDTPSSWLEQRLDRTMLLDGLEGDIPRLRHLFESRIEDLLLSYDVRHEVLFQGIVLLFPAADAFAREFREYQGHRRMLLHQGINDCSVPSHHFPAHMRRTTLVRCQNICILVPGDLTDRRGSVLTPPASLGPVTLDRACRLQPSTREDRYGAMATCN